MKAKHVVYVILSGLLVLPLSLQARVLLNTEGRIDRISATEILVGDLGFRLSPTVKVFSAERKPIPLKTLKPGDKVEIEVHQVDRKRFVDRIQLLK